MRRREDELDGVYRILAGHPRFRAFPAGHPSIRSAKFSPWVGWLIKEARLLRFGAEFDRAFTLLSFHVHAERPREVALSFQWHARAIRPDWAVFVHFLDEQGEICFQGDHPLSSQAPDALGFIYYRRRVVVPQGTPDGTYRIRLGVWLPAEHIHLRLTRFRGCTQEAPGWCHNAVLLGYYEIIQ